MEGAYHICPITDGLLYVEMPSFKGLITLLLQQKWRGLAHLRTREGYVPYSGGGIAFYAWNLILKGVKPIWYDVPGPSPPIDEIIEYLVAKGIYEDWAEANWHNHQQGYASECEWRGPKGMRFDMTDVAYVWIGWSAKKKHKMEHMIGRLRSFLPPHIPILLEQP
jgi:hypothetical protein